MKCKCLVLAQAALAVLIALTCCGCPPGNAGSHDVTQFRSYFVYTANTNSNDVSMFQANKSGKLEFLGKVAACLSPSGIVYDGDVYVTNAGDNTISDFSVGQDGRLTLRNTVPTGSTPIHITTSKEAPGVSDRLYVSCAGSNEVILYGIESRTGVLTDMKHFSVAGPGAATGELNCYLPSVTDNKLYNYQESGAGFIAGDPASVDTGDSPVKAYTTYLGSKLYVLNYLGASISVYQISDSKGNPILAPLGTVATGTDPADMAFDHPSSPTYAFVINQGIETIGAYSVSLEGDLTPVSGTQASAGTQPTAIAAASNDLTLLQRFIYVGNASGQVRLYSEGTDGSLTFVETYDTTGSNVAGIAITDHKPSVPLEITTDTLPDGTVGTPYSADLQVLGGVGDEAADFSVVSGQLPPGLVFDEAGANEPDRYTRLVGTPTRAGSYTFTLYATQPGIASPRKTFTIVITGNGGGGTDTAQFMNASPDGGNATLKIDGNLTVASNLAYPQLGTPVSLGSKADGAVHSVAFTNTTNSGASTTTPLTAGNSYLFFALGTHQEASLAVGRRVLPTGYAPPSGKAMVVLVDGLQSFPCDFYVLSGTTQPNGSNKTVSLNFGQTFEIQPELTAGTYQLYATSQGNPSDIIATGTLTIGDGKIDDCVLVSPPNVAATFVIKPEN